MTREELQRLAKIELIDMVLEQEAQIEKLETTLAEMEGWLAEAEAQRDRPAGMVESSISQEEMAEPVAIQRWTLCERATRDALRCLHDVAYLARCSLAELMARMHGERPQGRDLQQALLQAIEATRPRGSHPRRPRQQRRYDILRLTYLEKKRATEVTDTLGISERQYYRDLKAAIQQVAGHVLGL